MLGAGTVNPAGSSVSVTLNSVTQTATVGSTGNFFTTFDTATLGVAGRPYTVTYGFAGNASFDAASDSSTTVTVTKATATVVVTPYNVTYDGQSHVATITSIRGVNGETGATVGSVTLDTTHTDAGTYSGDSWSVAGAANYNDVASTTITNTISKASSTTTTVGDGPFTFDGTSHSGGSGTVTGAGGLSTSATSLTYSGDQIDAGTYFVTAHYAGDANHTSSDGSAVAITISTIGPVFSQGALNITGDNTVDLRIDPNNSTLLDVFVNKRRMTGTGTTPDATFSFALINKINVATTGDNAELFLDFGNGTVDPPAGITYDAGSGLDTSLDLFGTSPFTNEILTPTGPSSGSIVFNALAPFTFSNTKTVFDTVNITGKATYKGTNAGDTIALAGGGTQNGLQTTGITSGNGDFATVDFADKPTAVVQDSGADTFTINTLSASVAAGLKTLKVDATGSSGDTVNVQATGVTTDILAAGASTVNVGNAGSVQGILGTLNLENPSSFTTVVIDDSADATARTVTLRTIGVLPSDFNANSDAYGNISGLAPADIHYEYNDTSSLTVKGGTPASGPGNTFNVQATGAVTSIVGGGRNDTFNIGSAANSLAAIAAALSIDGGANQSSPTVTGSITAGSTTITRTLPVGDVVNVNDQGGPTGGTYSLTGTTVQRTGTGLITLSNTETLNLSVSAGADTVNAATTPTGITTIDGNGLDTFNITTTAASSLVTLNAAAAGSHTSVTTTGAGSLLFVHGNTGTDSLTLSATGSASGVRFDGAGGNDVVYVRSTGTGSATQLLGGAGNDAFYLGSLAHSLSGIQGILSVDGGAGINGLALDDSGDATGRAYTITNVQIDLSRAASILYTNLAGGLTVNGTQGDDLFSVYSLNQTVPTFLNGKGGNDSFIFYVNASSDYNHVQVDGGAGFNALNVSDVSGGAVIHDYKSSPTSGVVTADYPATLGSLHSEVQYRNIYTVITNPSADASYIQALFHQIYGRNASPYELDYYTGVLSAQGRLAVVSQLEHSPEGVVDTVDRYAREIFGRPATGDELNLGASLLLSGASEEEMLGAVFGSAMYFNSQDFRVREITSWYLRLFRISPPQSVVDAFSYGPFDLLTIRELFETDDSFYYYGL